MIFKRFVNNIKKLFISKFVWKKIGHYPIIIYDTVGANTIEGLFYPGSFYILETRFKNINILILIKSIIKYNLNWTPYSYILQFIKEIKPLVIITRIDNNPKFWELKKKLKNIKTIFIQNGFRDNVTDIFYNLKTEDSKKYSVDKMFVFNKAIGKEYSKYIKGEIFPTGSFNNNRLPVSNKDDGSILYISEWFKFSPVKENASYIKNIYFGESKIFYDHTIKTTDFLFSAVSKFAKEKKITLKVLGRSKSNDANEEERYFRNINKDFIYLKRDLENTNNTYNKIDESKFVVATDSTLGYEALGKGKKTAIISNRGKFLRSDPNGLKFGWPAKFGEKGPFWTNELDQVYFEKIMNYLMAVSEKEWIETISKFLENIMIFDYNNTILKKNLKKLNIKITS
jgi:surface carbohydrate biosynthesis protein